MPFPRPMLDDGSDFSFSGLKTAVVTYCRRHPGFDVADVAASFQAAVIDVLVTKLMRAARAADVDTVVIGGGVAANSGLRARVAEEAAAAGLRAVIPGMGLCTDNAAMIAACGFYRLTADGPTPSTPASIPGCVYRSHSLRSPLRTRDGSELGRLLASLTAVMVPAALALSAVEC